MRDNYSKVYQADNIRQSDWDHKHKHCWYALGLTWGGHETLVLRPDCGCCHDLDTPGLVFHSEQKKNVDTPVPRIPNQC